MTEFAGHTGSNETQNGAVVVMAKLLLSNISTESVPERFYPLLPPRLDKLVQAALLAGTTNIDLIRVITRSALKIYVSPKQIKSTLSWSASEDVVELMSYLFEAYGNYYTEEDLKNAFIAALNDGREEVFEQLASRMSPQTRKGLMFLAKRQENEKAVDALRPPQSNS